MALFLILHRQRPRRLAAGALTLGARLNVWCNFSSRFYNLRVLSLCRAVLRLKYLFVEVDVKEGIMPLAAGRVIIWLRQIWTSAGVRALARWQLSVRADHGDYPYPAAPLPQGASS